MAYLDKYGKAISEKKFFELQSDYDYRKVAATTVLDRLVSTIWYGGIGETSFETMIFGTADEYFCERYMSGEKAAQRHHEIVECLQTGNYYYNDEGNLYIPEIILTEELLINNYSLD